MINQVALDAVAAGILAGDLPASDAMGRTDLYDALNRGATGPLPFLGTSTKMVAGQDDTHVLSRVLYMQAAGASGRQACAFRSAGCEAACLVENTGRMSMTAAQTARRRRHASFYADRARFLSDLAREIESLRRSAERKGYIPAVRLNGTTDLPWERMAVTWQGKRHASLMDAFPGVQFYDYTKFPLGKRGRGLDGLPVNYHLTFSLSERADAEEHAAAYLDAGYPVAVVFGRAKGDLPAMYALAGGIRQVTDADKSDARFLDAPGTIAGLSMKGNAKTDSTGFTRYV